MLYTEKTKKAMQIMFKCHQNQLDKGNMPYVFHPWHVAEKMPDEDRTVVALLHDVIEDGDMTISDLAKEGFNNNELEALSLLTHNEKEDYFDYIIKISSNPIAADVKLEDLKHNSDLTRINNPTVQDLKRSEKYSRCIDFLMNSREYPPEKRTYLAIKLKRH